MKLKNLPENLDLKAVLLKIPDDCEQLTDKLDSCYLVSLHNSGNGLFVRKEKDDQQVYPIYPSKDNGILEWKVINYKEFE